MGQECARDTDLSCKVVKAWLYPIMCSSSYDSSFQSREHSCKSEETNGDLISDWNVHKVYFRFFLMFGPLAYQLCLTLFFNYGYVLSAPFSVKENRSWRHRAITITVNIRGPLGREGAIREALRGASANLDVFVTGDDGLGDKWLHDSSPCVFSTSPSTSFPSTSSPSTSFSSLPASSRQPLFCNNPRE